MLRSGGPGQLLRAIGEGKLLRRELGPGAVRMPVTTSTAQADALWTDLHERLRGFVGRRIGDPHTADDVAQDVLLSLHRSMGDLRVEDRLDAFAYRIARNAIIDHYRSRASAKESPTQPDDLLTHLDVGGDTDQDPDPDAARQELARCLAPLIRQLPEPYREALTLTDLGKLSQVEAAQVVGLSVPGMKARVQRARAQVHESLTGCCKVALDSRRQITDVQRTGPCACPPEPAA